jgi:AcrR family transcriptional regulator
MAVSEGEGPWDDGTIPEPPWRTPSSPSSRAPLTRRAVVEAALRVVDSEGVDSLSMRRVGEELGTGAASIYWHVHNKDELLQLVFEQVIQEIHLPEPDPARWREQLREFVLQIRQVFSKHRDVARLSLGRIPSGPSLAVQAEWLFALLRPVGIPDQVIAYLGDYIGLYSGAYAFEESLGPATFTGKGISPEQFFAMLKDYLLSLPQERFPNIGTAVDALFSGGPDARYEFGIDLMLRGLSSYIAGQPSS